MKNLESKVKSCDKIMSNYPKTQTNSTKNNTKNNFCILSVISQNANRKLSMATTDTNPVNPLVLDYDIDDTSKLDDSSLSDISELDLDAKEESDKELNDSFNTSDNEKEKKLFKKFKKGHHKQQSINCKEDVEYDDELEKELIAIKAEITQKRRLSVQPNFFFTKFTGKEI